MTVDQKDFFIRAQRKAYEFGKAGKEYSDTLGEIVYSNIAYKEYLTLGVQKCLKDEWERGNADSKRTLLPT